MAKIDNRPKEKMRLSAVILYDAAESQINK